MEREGRQDWRELYVPHRPDPDLPDVPAIEALLDSEPEERRKIDLRAAFDSRAGRIVRDVAVPVGLEARILDRIRQQPNVEKRLNRRRMLAGGLAVAAAVLLSFGFWIFRRAPAPWTPDFVAKKAIERFEFGRRPQQFERSLASLVPEGFDRTSAVAAESDQFLERDADLVLLQRQGADCLVIVLDLSLLSPNFRAEAPDYPFSMANSESIVQFVFDDEHGKLCILVARDLEKFRVARSIL